LGQRGASVALLARRESLIAEAARKAGPDSVAIPCDVTDEASCRSAISRAADYLGGIDAVVVSAGVGELRRIEDLDAATWQRVFATNVVGASLITAAALPHLKASQGMVTFLSSVSASLTAPWPGLASYTVTKAALDKLVEAWRAEHPEVGFTRLIIGECSGGDGEGISQLTASWDMELAGELFPAWTARGLLTDKLIEVDHLVGVVDALVRFGASASVPTLAITPRRPI
jgi:NAD(P)-dependent dehydrogenase (short-subunit alcohol dehydrogenase family)